MFNNFIFFFHLFSTRYAREKRLTWARLKEKLRRNLLRACLMYKLQKPCEPQCTPLGTVCDHSKLTRMKEATTELFFFFFFIWIFYFFVNDDDEHNDIQLKRRKRRRDTYERYKISSTKIGCFLSEINKSEWEKKEELLCLFDRLCAPQPVYEKNHCSQRVEASLSKKLIFIENIAFFIVGIYHSYWCCCFVYVMNVHNKKNNNKNSSSSRV